MTVESMAFAEVIERCMRTDAALRGIPVEDSAIKELKMHLRQWRGERSRLRSLSVKAMGNIRPLALVALSASGAHSYIERCADFAGAAGVMKAFSAIGGPAAGARFSVSELLSSSGFPSDCIVFFGGGDAVVLVSAIMAEEFRAKIEKEIAAAMPAVRVTTVHETFFPHELLFGRESFLRARASAGIFEPEVWTRLARGEPVPFGEIIAAMLANARGKRQEEAAKYPAAAALPPALRRCDSCGIALAADTQRTPAGARRLCATCARIAELREQALLDPCVAALDRLGGGIACAEVDVCDFEELVRRTAVPDELLRVDRTLRAVFESFSGRLSEGIGCPAVLISVAAGGIVAALPGEGFAAALDLTTEELPRLLQSELGGLGRMLKLAIGAARAREPGIAAGYVIGRAGRLARRAYTLCAELSAAGKAESCLDFEVLRRGAALSGGRLRRASMSDCTLKPYSFFGFREMARRGGILVSEIPPRLLKSLATRIAYANPAEAEIEICSLLSHRPQVRTAFEKQISSRSLAALPAALIWRTQTGYSTGIFDMLELLGPPAAARNPEGKGSA